MPILTPVDYDPFEKSAIKLTPVDYDPFANQSNVIPIRQPGQDNEAMRIFAPAKVRGLTLYDPGNESGGETSLSTYKGYSSPEWLRSVLDTLSLTDEYQGERARASNVLGLAETLNIRPSHAERDYDVLTGNIFTRDRLPDMGVKGAGEIAMLTGVARLAMVHPIATLVSIPAFAGLNALYTAILERQHGVPGEGLTGFLPENTIQPAKDMVWLAETIGQAYAVSPVFRLGKGLDARYTEPLRRAVIEKWFKDVTETFKPPESVYVSSGKIRRYFGGGKTGDEISPEEFDILQTYGIPREYYRAAIKQGLDIEIPAERIVTSADKPWWNEVKNVFRISPQWEPPTEVIKTGAAGDATVRPHVSGLLEGGTETRRSFTEIFKDLNNFLGESGQIGPKEKSVQQNQAAERLKKDLEIIKKEAERAGKDFASYLREAGYDEPAIAAARRILSLDEEPTETTPKAVGGIEESIILPRKEYILNTSPEYIEYSKKTQKVWDEYHKATEQLAKPGARESAYATSREEGIRFDREYDKHVQQRENDIRALGEELPMHIENLHYDSYPLKGIKNYDFNNAENAVSLLKEISSLDGHIGIRGIYKKEIGKKNLKPSVAWDDNSPTSHKLGGTSVLYAGKTSDFTKIEDVKQLLAMDVSGYGDTGIKTIVFSKESLNPHEIYSDVGEAVFPDAKVIGYINAPTNKSLAHYHAQAAGTKIVGESGEPLVVYHGTDKPEFDVFKPGWREPAIFLTPVEENAWKYAKGVGTPSPTARVEKMTVDIKNPLVVEGRTATNGLYPLTEAKMNELRGQGHDGIVSLGPSGKIEHAREIIPFSPEQIKRIPGAPAGGNQPQEITKQEIIDQLGTITIDLTDEANTLLDLAGVQDEARGPLPDNPTYEQIHAEAARLAWDKIKKKQDFMNRRMERAATQAALTAAREAPVYAAMTTAIKAGGFRYDDIRVDYSQDTIKELNRKRVGLVANDGKARLDELAVDHGFEDGDTLLEAMLSAEPIKETAGKIKRQFEDMMADELEAIAEDTGYLLDVYDEEEKILAKLLKENKPKPAKWLKHFIREETGQIRVGDLVLSEYDALKAAMKKAETASRIAYREGNKSGALSEKTRQREIAARLKARLDSKAEAKKIHDDIIKLSGNKKIPLDSQDQIAELLEGYDLLPRSSRGERQVESLQRFLDRAEAAGEDVDIPRSLLAKVERYGRVHWKDLTLAQLRDIYDQAKMIEHLGTLKGALLARAKERVYEKAIENITTTIKTNHPVSEEDIQGRIDRLVQARLLEPSRIQEITDFFTGYSASLIKPEMMFRFLDNFRDLGPTWMELYHPIKTASDAGIRLRQVVLPKLEKLFEPFTAASGYRWKSEKYYIPEIRKTMTKERMLMVALNTGNRGNLDALIGGYGWDETQINAITNKLAAEEWKFVQGIWDLLEELWPYLSGVYERMSGARLRRVEGNYFPLKFDRKLSWMADKNAMEKDLRDFFQSYYATRQPESGFTKERTGGKMPPLLDFDVIFSHIADVTHYVTHAEAIRDVQKLLRDPRVRAVIESVPDIGEAGYKELLPWLQDIARPRIAPLDYAEKWLDFIRRNTTVVALGLKLPVAELQLLAITQTINEIGIEATMKGIAEFYAHPVENIRKIKELSAEMSVRAAVWDRELKDAYGRLGLEYFKHSQTVKDAFFGLISTLDMAVAYPTWMGAYDIGVARFGESKQAIEFADMSVRKSQAVALTKDLAGIQRGGALTKLVTMFYTFLSGLHNLFWEMHKKWKLSDEKIAPIVDLIKGHWWQLMFPAVVGYAIRERQVPSAKTAGKEILKYRLATYPLIRDIVAPWLSNYDYQISPVVRAGEVIGNFGKEIGQGLTGDNKFDASQLFLYGMESSGYVFGLPTDQAKITVKGFLDLKAGKTNDFTRLLFREPQKQK